MPWNSLISCCYYYNAKNRKNLLQIRIIINKIIDFILWIFYNEIKLEGANN